MTNNLSRTLRLRRSSLTNYSEDLPTDSAEEALFFIGSLPDDWQQQIEEFETKSKLQEMGIETDTPFNPVTVENDALSYAEAPDYNRQKFNKYATILRESEGLKGRELKDWIKKWNLEHPLMETCYPRIMDARRKALKQGMSTLIGQYGKTAGRTTVEDIWNNKFKELYLIEGGPSANQCWICVVGIFCSTPEQAKKLPKVEAFTRRLQREVGKSAIYLARNGFKKWNRKYAGYIERDYDKFSAGEVWVSDHAQIDVAVKSRKDGKPVFGWITSFTDMKTNKALSCFYHEEAPNSDHIFQAFYLAVTKHGLPKYVYIDNGKDYRCRDFASGRKHYRLNIDEGKARGMLLDLGVIPIFAIPYNSQAKNIEPWHLRIKNGFSRNSIGFRGGNVTERPEKLEHEIKQGKILDFEVFNELLQDFLANYLNKFPSTGKGCKGKSPDDAWNLENPVKRTVSREALKLFCSRTTKALTIGRNGVKHSQYKVTYFAEWMVPLKGTKVYLRIAPDNVNDAWVFTENTDEYLGNASIKGLIHPVAENEIDRAALREANAAKNRDLKLTKELGYTTHVPDTAERLNAMKAGIAILNPEPVPEPEQKVEMILPNCSMQQAVTARKRIDREGKNDLSGLAKYSEIEAVKRELAATQGKILHFESDRSDREEKIKELEFELQRLEAMGQ